MTNAEIIPFLCRAKRATYAGKSAETAPCRPGSHDLAYAEGPFSYYDTYLGGHDFVGEEALWIDGKPYWSMNYAGRVTGDPFNGDFLKEALLHVPADKPFRGPAFYAAGDYTYRCEVQGDFTWFQGHETIACKGTELYDCHFHGSLIR